MNRSEKNQLSFQYIRLFPDDDNLRYDLSRIVDSLDPFYAPLVAPTWDAHREDMMLRRTLLLTASVAALVAASVAGSSPGAQSAVRVPRTPTTTAAPTTTTTTIARTTTTTIAPTTTTTPATTQPATTLPPAFRDLAITQTVTGSAVLGQPLRITTTVTNVGTVAVPALSQQGVTTPNIITQLRSVGHFSIVSTTGVCQVIVNTSQVEAVRCDSAAPLNPGQSLTTVSEYVPLVAGALTLAASVPPPLSRENNYSNNFASYTAPTIADLGPTDVAVSASGAIDNVFTDQVHFSFAVRNNGVWGLSNVNVTISSPNGFWFAPGGCVMNLTATAATCRTGQIAAGGEVTNEFTVKRAANGSASMTVSVTPPVIDSFPGNNTGSASV